MCSRSLALVVDCHEFIKINFHSGEISWIASVWTSIAPILFEVTLGPREKGVEKSREVLI